jgi:hypothetical protein
MNMPSCQAQSHTGAKPWRGFAQSRSDLTGVSLEYRKPGGFAFCFGEGAFHRKAAPPLLARCCGNNRDPVRRPAVSIPFTQGSMMFRKLHDAGGEAVTVYIDGARVTAEANESVAAVLLRQAPVWSRTTPVSNTPRAPYCMMGVCFDCLATVDGVSSIQTCLAPVRDGMRIDRQHGRPDVAS